MTGSAVSYNLSYLYVSPPSFGIKVAALGPPPFAT
jgi:hypothetical protein